MIPPLNSRNDSEQLCSRCQMIHVIEGQIPAACALCVPPRKFVPHDPWRFLENEGVVAPDGSGWSR